VARLTFERELATKVAQAESMVMNDANNGLITQIEATERLAAVQRLASDTRAEFMAQQADQINQQYDAMRGVNDAVKEYQLSISKMGENTKGVMTNAFRGMEDALTNFVRTGKLDFKSLADSIISDMIRMQIQQSVTGPLAGILGKAIGSYFGGGGGADFGTGAAYGSQDMGTYFANGGVMSSGGPLPMQAYSNGGIADSPQLAIFGEGRMNEAYVPLPDGRTIPVTMSGGGGANVVVNVLPGSGQTADVKTSQDSQGNMTLDVVIRQIEDSMAGNMAAGSGSLFNATASRFVPQGAR
jgi:lambda family phage tail tape measure protein